MKTLLILAALIGCPGRTDQLRITVCDKAKLNGRVMDDVSDKLRRIFRQAGIKAEILGMILMSQRPPRWYARRGRLPNDDSRWLASPDDDIALSIVVTPRGLQAGILGMAMPLSTTGLNTRVFVDHVATTAFRENRSFGNVLAHAMAHEIGHVLLRSAGHEGHGIMASPWTTREYDQMTVLRTMTFLANIRHVCGILLPGETVMRFSISSVESILFFTVEHATHSSALCRIARDADIWWSERPSGEPKACASEPRGHVSVRYF